MSRVHDHDDLIVEQGRRQNAPIADWVADDGDVESSFEQMSERLAGGGRIDANVDLWMRGPVALEQRGQPVVTGVALGRRRSTPCLALAR